MAILTRETGKTSGTGNWENPEEGVYQAVVVDVIDCGWVEHTVKGVPSGLKPKIQIAYQIVGEDEEGEPYATSTGMPFIVRGFKNVLSMDDRSNLYKEIANILGKKKFDEMLDSGEFDTENLIGCNVDISVVHNGNYANIESCKPWHTKRGPAIVAEGYERMHEREKYEEPEFSAFGPMPPGATLEKAREAKGKFEKSPLPQRNGKVELDPRSVNPRHNPSQAAKDVLAGKEPPKFARPQNESADDDDNDDPFADE